MTFSKAMQFVDRSRIELTVVGMGFLLGGAAAGFTPAAQAGWTVLSLVVLTALRPQR